MTSHWPTTAVLDDVGAAVQGDGRADVGRDRQQRGADRDALGLGCLDDQVLLAVDDRPGIVELEQACARAPTGSAATAL